MSLAQIQWRHDDRTCPSGTLTRRVGGDWWNGDAVVQSLEQPECIAQTDNPAPGHADTCTLSSRVCMWLNLPHRASVTHHEVGVSIRSHTSLCCSQPVQQRSWLTATCLSQSWVIRPTASCSSQPWTSWSRGQASTLTHHLMNGELVTVDVTSKKSATSRVWWNLNTFVSATAATKRVNLLSSSMLL